MKNQFEKLEMGHESAHEPLNEKTLFGQVKLGARVPGGFEGFKEQKPGKINQSEEMEKIRKLQPEEMTLFADELHTAVLEQLHVENPDQLHFYTAIGTKLDFGLGIDGFMELDMGKGKMVRVTLDGTESFYKMENGKPGGKNEADIIFLWPEESEQENPFEWNLAIQKAAQAIAEHIKAKAGGVLANLTDEELELSQEIAEKETQAMRKKQKAIESMRSHRLKK